MNALARIGRLSAAFLGSNLARGAIAFLLSLLVGRALGVDRFGRWILCSTWASTLTVAADLGLGLLLHRDQARGSLCASALVLRLAVATPAAVAMVIAAPWIVSDPETIRGLQIAAILGLVGAAYGCLGSSLRSEPDWVTAVLTIETAWHAVQLVASWVLLHAAAAPDVPALLTIAVAVQAAQIVTALAVWRMAFGGREPIRPPAWRDTRDTFVRALPFAAAGIVANLQTRMAPLMLGYLSPESELGAFAAAARFGTTARLAPGAIFAGALPVLSREHERGDADSRTAFASFDRAFAAFALVTAIAGAVLAVPLLRLVYGPAFVAAAPALVWICIGLAPTLTNSATKIALYAAGAERVATAWSAVSLAIQIVMALALMPRFGAVGAAWAIAVGEVVIWVPLRRARRAHRTLTPSSPHRAPASTLAPPQPSVRDVPDPAAAR